MDLQRLLTIREVDRRDPVEMARWLAAQVDALRAALGWDGLTEAALRSLDREAAMTRRGVPPTPVDDGGLVDNPEPTR